MGVITHMALYPASIQFNEGHDDCKGAILEKGCS